jgi:DNA-binding CsgD family transcriptional regulator
MKFSAEWQDPGVSASAELRATFCLLDIDVGGRRVSRFFDERYSRAHNRIAMPAYPVAQGLARAWWLLLAGRSGTIRLRRFRDGFALPDIRFEPDGHYVEIIAAPFEYSNPPVTFTRSAEERVGVDDLERDMGEFIDAVVEKLSDYRIRSWLQDRWSAIQASLEDEEERVFCEAAGALGVDPYLCDEGETQAIEAAAAYFDDEGLLEFLASQRGQQPGLALEWLETAEAQLAEKAALPAVAEIAGKLGLRVALASLNLQPWQLGYRLAEECRAFVDLNPERIFADVADIGALFGRTGFTVASGRVRGLRAEAYRDNGAPKIIVADLPVPQSRTFAMMRAIGDFLAFQQDGRSPITDTYSYRQGVGRAFAVELLAPAETILQMQQDGMTPDEIAIARNVSERAISWHLENRQALVG